MVCIMNARVQQLYDEKYCLINLKPNEKIPIHQGYMRDTPEVLLSKFKHTESNVAMRMGFNTLNGRYMIGLDFDCIKKKKKGDGYEDCNDTIALKDEYISTIGSEDGMYYSSTAGNINILLDITNSQELQNIIQVLPSRWSAPNLNLELLLGCIMVLPPSKTPNKKTGKIEYSRNWCNENNIYVVSDDNDPIVFFITDYIKDHPCKSKNKYKTKKDAEIDVAIEDALEQNETIIHPKDLKLTEKLLTEPMMKKQFDDYEMWWKIGYAIYNTHGSSGMDIFVRCSRTPTYPNADVKTYWKGICEFMKNKENKKKYAIWNDLWLLNLFKHSDCDTYRLFYTKAIEFKNKMKYVEDKERFENKDGEFRVCKIGYKGLSYTLWDKSSKSLDICEWDKIKHSCLEDFDNGFFERWFDDRDKAKVYDVNIYPYGEVPENCINLFTGFPLHAVMENKIDNGWKPNQEYISQFKQYVSRVCGKGEDKACVFITQFISHILFKGRPKICLIVRGKHGCGKGSFVSLIKCLVGDEYWIDDPQGKRIFSRFNAQFQNKLLICIDEPDWGSTANQIEDFKNRITEPTLTIEKKGIDAYELDNWITIVMTTNNKNLFKLTKEDRRFFFLNMDAFDGTPEEKNIYFTEFYKNLKDEEYLCSVLYYLKSVHNPEYYFEGEREMAMTTYQKILTGVFDESDPLPFLKEYIQREDLNIYVNDGGEWVEKLRDKGNMRFYVSEDEIYNDYKMYCKDIKPISKINVRQEVSILQGDKCEKKVRIGDSRIVVWDIAVSVLMKGLENC